MNRHRSAVSFEYQVTQSELEYAKAIAHHLNDRHWKYSPVKFEVGETMMEVLTQIDNMTACLKSSGERT
jgi:hypothetical protein